MARDDYTMTPNSICQLCDALDLVAGAGEPGAAVCWPQLRTVHLVLAAIRQQK